MKYCDACHSAYPDDFSICPRDQGPLRHASELLPGMVLRGKYEVLEKIGSGGMASVYRARHLAFGEVCAIKVVGPKLAYEEAFLRRFRNEAVVTRKLQHPHAVRVDDLDTTEDGRPFIVMEYVEGRNLREVIKQEAPLPPARAVEIARQAASALAAAHALGIVHRDIKPDNILLAHGADGTDYVKVLDFGIAKVKEGVLEAEAYTPTRTGMVVGTPQYVSPEQAMGKRGEDVDGRSDLYSLGVVVYEMLTGRLPFASDTAMGMILHHLQTAPTPPQAARPDLDIPAPLSDLLMRALRKEREERFASAEEMAAALEAVVPELPAYTPALQAGTGSTAPALRTPTPPMTGHVSPVAQPQRTPTPPGASSGPSTPRPEGTRVEDIAELPTRSFPAEGAVTSIGAATVTQSMPASPPLAPAGPSTPSHRSRRDTLVWIAVGLAFVLLFAWRNRDRNERRAAEQAAAASPEATPSPAEAIDDAEIQEAIARLLDSARATRDEEIEVEVDEGRVTLDGRVRDPAAAQVAEALAESYPGVKEVRNKIKMAAERESSAGTIVVPLPPLGPLGHPPSPGTAPHEALNELLREGRQALDRGDVEEAMAIYGAALTLDPRNQAARQGMQETARRMRLKGRHRYWTPPSVWPFVGQKPSPPAPPSPKPTQ